MKYKIGDKVRIKSLDWYNKNKNNHDYINFTNGCAFSPGMSIFCGDVCTITRTYKCHNDDYVLYGVEENNYNWTDEMIEGIVEEENKTHNDMCKQLIEEMNPNIEMNTVVFNSNIRYNKVSINTENCSDEVEINISDEYELVEKEGKLFAVKKKPKYPQTYEECCEVLGTEDDAIINISVPLHYNSLLIAFTQLLICRDAYWKIAGEEMGLGKPWKPDFLNDEQDKFCLYNSLNNILQGRVCETNEILVFPTEEMRDAFYEAFKELINEVKELM